MLLVLKNFYRLIIQALNLIFKPIQFNKSLGSYSQEKLTGFELNGLEMIGLKMTGHKLHEVNSKIKLDITAIKKLQLTSIALLVLLTMTQTTAAWADSHIDEHEHHASHEHHHEHHEHPDHKSHQSHHNAQHVEIHSESANNINKGRSERRYINISDLPASIRNKTEVAVSNYPLFLLSQAVTKGAPSATLLLDKGDVGHHASLSPSDMKTIKDSRYVVWFGDELESNLVKPFASSPNTISLFEINGFHRLPLRDVKGQAIQGTLDPHIWLDPYNAKAITRALGAIFSRANPKYKDVYQQNVKQFAQDMDTAVSQAKAATSLSQPYWAYHDAFGYIESTLNLKLAGTLTTDHHLPPKASQFYWLRQTKPKNTMCMVLQSDNNQGVLDKLKPIRSTIQQEDMNDATDFIAGWLKLAEDINQCVR